MYAEKTMTADGLTCIRLGDGLGFAAKLLAKVMAHFERYMGMLGIPGRGQKN